MAKNFTKIIRQATALDVWEQRTASTCFSWMGKMQSKTRTNIREILKKSNRDKVDPRSFNQRVAQYEREERSADFNAWKAKQQIPMTRRMRASKETIIANVQPVEYGEKKISDFNKALAELRKKAKN